MATREEVLAAVAALNTTVTEAHQVLFAALGEVAADIRNLIAQLSAPGFTVDEVQEIVLGLQQKAADIAAVADAFKVLGEETVTTPAPEEPPPAEEPPAEEPPVEG